jgi:choline dehydrogenase-like flavoprotein
VIVAAGSQHTPQLLLLSGIGDKSLLNSLGINVVADLPGVGQNFHDHGGMVGYGMFLNDLNPSPSNTTNATWLAEQRVLYDTQKKGACSLEIYERDLSIHLTIRRMDDRCIQFGGIPTIAQIHKSNRGVHLCSSATKPGPVPFELPSQPRCRSERTN